MARAADAAAPARSGLSRRRCGFHLRPPHREGRGPVPDRKRPAQHRRGRLRHPAPPLLRYRQRLLHLHRSSARRQRLPRARAEPAAEGSVLSGGRGRQQLWLRHRGRREALPAGGRPEADRHRHRGRAARALRPHRTGVQRLHHPAPRRQRLPRAPDAAAPARSGLLHRQHRQLLRQEHPDRRQEVPDGRGPAHHRRGRSRDPERAVQPRRSHLSRAREARHARHRAERLLQVHRRHLLHRRQRHHRRRHHRVLVRRGRRGQLRGLHQG